MLDVSLTGDGGPIRLIGTRAHTDDSLLPDGRSSPTAIARPPGAAWSPSSKTRACTLVAGSRRYDLTLGGSLYVIEEGLFSADR